MAIIGILASMMLGPMAQALRKARGLVGELEEPIHLAEIKHQYQAYRSTHKEHGRLDRDEFIRACDLGWKCRQWLRSPDVRFSPFSANDPLDKIILECRMSVVMNAPKIRYYRLSSLLEIPKLAE
jgi:hypothetical protein